MNSVNAAQLALWVSGDRLKRYEDHPGATVDLYVHNAHRASVMIEVLQHIDVLVRNVIHRELSASRQRAGIPWYLDTAHFGFSRPMQGKLSHAVSAAGGPGATGGKVVAELMFGTWRYLLSSQYQSTVWAVVSRGFHGVPRSQRKREELYNSMTYLNAFRNRCSHAEPVYPVPTTVFLTHVCTVARYISPDAAAWLHDLWFERTGHMTLALLNPRINAATP